MTYTFKLARRLAVSRNFHMLPVLLLFAACSGDATAPEASTANPQTPGTLTPVALRINPGNVTLETNQLIHFRALSRTGAGDTVGAAVTWSTTGGTILPDGRFSAAVAGTYKVIGRSRVRSGAQADTSAVLVVRRQPGLAAVVITPRSVSLTPGKSQTFTALGRRRTGTQVPIGVNWVASGGSIDGGGTYVAGDTPGVYRVIASNTAGTLADTASVTIGSPPPTPAPVITQLFLVPATVTLAPSVVRQFQAYGRTATGDSLAANVTFTATGGTVTPGGLYTAGATGGAFGVIASSGGLADTSAVTIKVPLGSGSGLGLPFGSFSLWTMATTQTLGTSSFTMSEDYIDAAGIVNRISTARAKKLRLVLAMTGGAHSEYLVDGKFNLAKWKARMDTFNTPEIRDAVAAGVADGTVIGASVMDEPEHATWGGVMTKPMVDQMAAYMKAIFPTLPAGVDHGPNGYYLWRPTERYTVVDYVMSQYNWWVTAGDVVSWRDNVLAQAALDHVSVIFSLNILAGGIHLFDGGWTCPLTTTGGQGPYKPVCSMSPTQVRDWGLALGPYGCGLMMWDYNPVFMARAENQQAFKDIATDLAGRPAKSCRRQG